MNMHMAKSLKAEKSKADSVNLDDFASLLRRLMLERKISASDLAREVWGTFKDKRGYEVARNRDRIGHYLSGKSHPGPDNLLKIAKALAVKSEVLEKVQPAPTVREAETKSPKDIQVTYSEGVAIMSMAKLRLSSQSVATILEIVGKDPVHSKMHYVPLAKLPKKK